MWPNDVLMHAKDYTVGEPRIIAYPDAAGMYVVGYCDYEGVTQFAKAHRELWEGKRPIEPLVTGAEVRNELYNVAIPSWVRYSKLLKNDEIIPAKD